MDISRIGNLTAQLSVTQNQTQAATTRIAGASATSPAAPVETPTAVQQADVASHPDALKNAVNNLNQAMQSQNQSLEFSIDPDSDRVVVKLIDQNTKEVLRQIPSKEALEMAKSLDRMQGLFIKQKV